MEKVCHFPAELLCNYFQLLFSVVINHIVYGSAFNIAILIFRNFMNFIQKFIQIIIFFFVFNLLIYFCIIIKQKFFLMFFIKQEKNKEMFLMTPYFCTTKMGFPQDELRVNLKFKGPKCYNFMPHI